MKHLLLNKSGLRNAYNRITEADLPLKGNVGSEADPTHGQTLDYIVYPSRINKQLAISFPIRSPIPMDAGLLSNFLISDNQEGRT